MPLDTPVLEVSAEALALVCRLFEDVMDRGRLESVGEMFTADAVLHNGSQEDTVRTALPRLVRGFAHSFPDIRHTIHEIVESPGRLAVLFSGEGTHEGDFLGLPATGRHAGYRAMMLLKLTGGQISEIHIVGDMMNLLNDLWD